MMDAGEYFLEGNIACAEAAMKAGCEFYAGYPITPASEVMNHLSKELPKVGGRFVQMEDEIASIASVIGSSWAGLKSMTATSGPGFSLMQENLGYAVMTETPCVVVNVQRAGPSTGQATKPGTGDVMQSRFGSQGDYEIIALSPNSVQEMFDLTVRAFNLSERYRVPAVLLADAGVGHMREKVKIPEEVEVEGRKRPEKGEEEFFDTDEEDHIPPMPDFGEGHELLVTGSTHLGDGTRDTASFSAQDRLVRRLVAKIEDNRGDIEEWEEQNVEDAELVVVSYGSISRPARGAVKKAREEGHDVGFFRPKTMWPSPEKRLKEIAEDSKVMLVELSLRGYRMEVERCVGSDDFYVYDRLNSLPTVDMVHRKIEEVMR
ncbi:MAG: 2-oxoacid:acceptor oxidoreductase subunit alpha [Candidatus Aenigmatarchaeota archaeon]